MWYELFIRHAFSLNASIKDYNPISRLEDPAKLADAGIADSEENINAVKVAVGYSIEIFAAYDNSSSNNKPYENALNLVLSASCIADIKAVVENLKPYLKNHNLW